METSNNSVKSLKDVEDAKVEDEEFERISNYQDILKTEDCVLDVLNSILDSTNKKV